MKVGEVEEYWRVGEAVITPLLVISLMSGLYRCNRLNVESNRCELLFGKTVLAQNTSHLRLNGGDKQIYIGILRGLRVDV